MRKLLLLIILLTSCDNSDNHGNLSIFDEPSEEQLKAKQLWEQARTEILNNGNSQLRIAQEEIAQYTMTWNRYHIDFVLTPPNQDNQEI